LSCARVGPFVEPLLTYREGHDDNDGNGGSSGPARRRPARGGVWQSDDPPRQRRDRQLDDVGFDPGLRDLLRLRASQINGCAY
jgi:hypothetical protein